MAMLTLKDISRKEKDGFVVKNVNFSLERLEKFAIAGETGSGKTTLLKMIAGLIQPSTGEIRFENKKILGPEDHLIPGNPGIAYLSQQFELRNNYWVHELLSYANTLSEKAAMDLYAICRIEHLISRRTDQLSGGEKQRIALARLLIGSPGLLLLDEPFSNLDMPHKRVMQSVISDIASRMGVTCIMVLHEPGDLLSWSDRIMILRGGEIIQQGKSRQIYQQPVDEYIAGLLGPYTLISGELLGLIRQHYEFADATGEILIRPESFTIVKDGQPRLEGVIRSSTFWGSYYLLEVLIGGQIARIQSAVPGTPGERLTCSLKPESIVHFANPAKATYNT